MILEIKVYREYHSNGNLKYQGTWGILSKAHAHLYENRRGNYEYEWIWCGLCGRWDETGRQIWVLNYDQKGNLLNKSHFDSYVPNSVGLTQLKMF